MSQEFPNRLREAINCCSKENGSNTPDFILTSFLIDVLDAWDKAVTAREKWFGREPKALVFKSVDMTAPAVTPDHLDDSRMNTTNPNKVT